MKQIWRFAIVSLGPWLVLCLIWLGWVAISYIRGNCDPKFGCFGSFLLVIFIAMHVFVYSLLGNLTASLIFFKAVRLLSGFRLFGVLVALSLAQFPIFISGLWLYKISDSITSVLVACAAMSALIALGVLYLAHRWPSKILYKSSLAAARLNSGVNTTQ